jgi:hypothetical protein
VNRIAWIAELLIGGSISVKNSVPTPGTRVTAHTITNLHSLAGSGELFAHGICGENVTVARPSNFVRLHGIREPEVTNILQESRKFNWRDKSHGGNVGAPSQSL